MKNNAQESKGEIDMRISALEEDYDSYIFLAEGCIYDHQNETKHALLRKADIIRWEINELKKQLQDGH